MSISSTYIWSSLLFSKYCTTHFFNYLVNIWQVFFPSKCPFLYIEYLGYKKFSKCSVFSESLRQLIRFIQYIWASEFKWKKTAHATVPLREFFMLLKFTICKIELTSILCATIATIADDSGGHFLPIDTFYTVYLGIRI
jgi:hypothetical protein